MECKMKFTYPNVSPCLLLFLSVKLNPSSCHRSDWYCKPRKIYSTYRVRAVFVKDPSRYLNCAELLSCDSAKES